MKNYSCLMTLILMVSCNTFQDKTVKTGIPTEILPLNINPIFKGKTLSDFTEIKSIIPLHGIKSSELLSTISKVVVFNGSFFILDRNFSKLYVFDLKGEFKYSIGDLGEAPGQYQNINDFYIDKIKNIIVLYSNDSMSIFTYNLSGKFIERVKLPFFGYSFAQLDSTSYLFYTNFNRTEKRYNIFETNLEGEIFSEKFPYSEDQNMGIGFSGFLVPSSVANEYNLSIGLSDTVFNISRNKIQAKYFFNFNDKNLKNDIRLNHNAFFKNGLDYSLLRNNFIETNDVCFYDYQHNRVINYGFFFKSSFQNYNFNRQRQEDFFEKIINVPVGTVDNEIFISFLDTEIVRLFIKENPKLFSQIRDKQPLLYEAVKQNKDNLSPILVTFSLQSHKNNL